MVRAIFIVVAFPAIPPDPAQAAKGFAYEKRRTGGRCAEASGQAGEEGDWRTGGQAIDHPGWR